MTHLQSIHYGFPLLVGPYAEDSPAAHPPSQDSVPPKVPANVYEQ